MSTKSPYKAYAEPTERYIDPETPKPEILGLFSVRIVTTREQPIFANGTLTIGQFIDDYLIDCAKDGERVESFTLHLGEPK